MYRPPVSGPDPSEAPGAIPAELFESCYQELRDVAGRALGSWSPGQTLQATALVHEAWIRMSAVDRYVDLGRKAFLGFAALNMRRILVESHRARNRDRRGGALDRVPLFDSIALDVGRDLDLDELDAALDKLAAVDPRAAKVVQLKFFGGLREAEVAEILGIGVRTVSEDWRYARTWLAERLEAER